MCHLSLVSFSKNINGGIDLSTIKPQDDVKIFNETQI